MKIAVELDPPEGNARGDALSFLGNGTVSLVEAGADFITMADNPRSISRGDSVAVACLVHALTGAHVVPHITCRDRNELSIRSALTALDIAGLHEVLAVTGDRPGIGDTEGGGETMTRGTRLCAADLAGRIAGWNRDANAFSRPFRVSAALNCNARNFDAELRRAERKETNGVERFLTQPIFSGAGIRNLERARRALGAEIFGGILPLVSHRNAEFLASVMPGIGIGEEIIDRYRGLDKEEAVELAIRLSLECACAMTGSVDGYYLITPFRRIDIIESLVRTLRGAKNGFLERATQTASAG